MAAINDIIVSVINGSMTATGVNFGVPLLIGFTGSKTIVRWGSGNSGAVAVSVDPQVVFTLRVIVTGSSYIYAIGSENDVTITVPTTARVRDLLTDFAANASAPIQALIGLQATGTGSGLVEQTLDADDVLTTLGSAGISYLKVIDISQLQYYYASTSTEYKMVQNVLASSPSPNVIYVLDCYGKTGSTLTSYIALYDVGQWYIAMTTATDQTTQQTLADHFDSIKRIILFVSNVIARPTVVGNGRVSGIIHDVIADHPEAAWAAKALPNVPGQGWKFLSDLQGQTPNTTSTLTDLITVRENKAQSYITKNGLNYVDGSQMWDQTQQIYIDQVIGRDWISLNLETDLLTLFVRAAAQGSKIPYTDGGINQVLSTIANRLTTAGKLGIVAPVETQIQAAASYDGLFRFNVTSLTRTEIEQQSPTDITNRVLSGVKYSYIENTPIEKVEVTGIILLTE